MGATGVFLPHKWQKSDALAEFRRAFCDGCNVTDYYFSPKKNFEGDTVVYIALETPEGTTMAYVATYFTRWIGGGHYEMVYRLEPEIWGPAETDCPKSILDKLTPTEDKNFSLETILKSHINLLAEKAKNEHSAAGLCALTHAIVELAPLIQSLSDDGLVSYPVQVQMTMQDLTDLYRGRHLAQQQMLSDNETRLNQAR